MDYEQKYKDALDAARHIYDAMKSGGNFGGMEDLEVIFPELAESEDERIRKWLVDYFTKIGESWIHREFTCKQIVAYLEKKKEQYPAVLINGFLHQLLQNGTITLSDYLYLIRKPKPAEKQDYSGLNDLERAIHRGFLAAGVENVPIAIIKETAQECLDVVTNREAKWLLLNGCISFEEYLKIADVPYADKILQERKARQAEKVKPAEWSEKDESMRWNVISIVGQSKSVQAEEMMDWLKSLRPDSYKNCNSRWKPSEEQMEALERCVEYLEESDNEDADILAGLYEQLKAL